MHRVQLPSIFEFVFGQIDIDEHGLSEAFFESHLIEIDFFLLKNIFKELLKLGDIDFVKDFLGNLINLSLPMIEFPDRMFQDFFEFFLNEFYRYRKWIL